MLVEVRYVHKNLPCGPAMLSRRKSSGDPPETSRRGPPDFLAKSLVIPAIYTKFKLKFVSDKLEFRKNGWNYQPKNPETLRRGSPWGLRTISAGTTLLVHTVSFICDKFAKSNYFRKLYVKLQFSQQIKVYCLSKI